eukprot:4109648-Prymnesium_polylepis.1
MPITDGNGFESAFQSNAYREGLSISVVLKVFSSESNFDEQYRDLAASEARVIMIACHASTAGSFIVGALAHNLGGAGYLWFGADAVSNADLWTSQAELQADPALQERALRGFFGIAARSGHGAAYTSYVNR